MGGSELGFDSFDAAVVHVSPALGNDPPGFAFDLANPASHRASIIDRPGAESRPRGSSLLGTSAKMPANWASLKFADLRAEEHVGGPLGDVQALGAVDQPGQFGRQPPLGRAPARIGLVLAQHRSISSRSKSVKNRRHLPTSASSRLIQY